jgi:hypothetical protein
VNRRQVWHEWVKPDPARYPTPAACRFIRGEDFMALALKAYLAASRELVPPAGERWVDDLGNVWSGPEGFFDALLHHLGERLRWHAIDSKHLLEVPWSAEDIAEDARSSAEFMAMLEQAARNVSPVGGGRSPPDKGHGWPALAPAVGPAPVPCPEAGDSVSPQSLDITIPANPLLFGQQVQELPGETSRVTVDQSGEKLS